MEINAAMTFAWAGGLRKRVRNVLLWLAFQSAHGHPGLRGLGQTLITPVMPMTQCAAQKW
jgi:hypothetical protein